MARLRSSKRKVGISETIVGLNLPPLDRYTSQLDVWQLPSMAAAAATVPRRLLYCPEKGWKKTVIGGISSACVNGDHPRLMTALGDSDELIADAIAADPRLARRSQWTRGEEGEVVCPALLSQGDDAPCFYRKRAIVGQPNGAEPVRVVISTDSSEIKPRTAAAFIATVRLVQQYRPVEIWWQGSWLSTNRNTGWVFHVPLVKGDMDFARLEFCIADKTRDNLSFAVMMTRACEETHCVWNGCSLQAQSSYLPGDDSFFVGHDGIEPDGDGVAANAACWLGWEPVYQLRWDYESSVEGALQKLPDPIVEYVPRKLTKEEERKNKADSERWSRERKEREADNARQREKGINLSTT